MKKQTIVSICTACDGTGYADYAAVPCEECDGDGCVMSRITIWDARATTAWVIAIAVVTAMLTTWALEYVS